MQIMHQLVIEHQYLHNIIYTHISIHFILILILESVLVKYAISGTLDAITIINN